MTLFESWLKSFQSNIKDITKTDLENDEIPSSGKPGFFTDPGIYELKCHGLEQDKSKTGVDYYYFKLTDSTGREAKMMFSPLKKDGTPNVASIYKILSAFKITVPPSFILKAYNDIITLITCSCKGTVNAKAEYWGYWVKRIEKGHFQVVDKNGNPLLDPVHNEVVPHESYEAAVNYATQLSITIERNLHWGIVDVVEHTPTEDGVLMYGAILQAIEAITNNKQEANIQPPKPENKISKNVPWKKP